MIKNSLESIEYIDRMKFEVISNYKNKYRNQPIKDNNLWIVVRQLFEIIKPNGNLPVDKKYRQRVITRCLNQLTSDSYIESRIDWNQFNNLNNMIDAIELDEIEQDVYKDIDIGICDIGICNRCFRFS